MPIQINLLAEAHALEEQRRRDPIKRVILGGAVLVVLILVWSSSLMVNTMIVKGEVSRFETSLNSRTNEYRQVVENQSKLSENRQKIEALTRLSCNRFLIGNLLDTMQKTMVDNVQLMRMKLDQSYVVNDSQTNATGSTKSATATERIVLTLSAKDTSPNPGDGVSKYQQALSDIGYFREALGKSGGFRQCEAGIAAPGDQGVYSARTHIISQFQHIPSAAERLI